ncbi:MAG: amidohydrolase family protein [Deltaproteobacteria bacterium]|nr:amidohydrolase family protein [Deltaproteobacteria bacterium]MBW2395989.1 amidohydrolase family protein [Deltaproteobacteria bacterium]
MGEAFELLVRGGLLIDGTGAPARRADVGVRGGRVAAIGDDLGRDAERILDADGRVVAPGFVDIHTHYDAQIFWDRMLTVSPWHGVTSVVVGNCGFGIAPTRPDHRDLILRTLENVEGMSLEALRLGVGDDWPFESFPEFLDAIEQRGTAINVGALIGHTPLRLYVMGEEATEREATEAEIAEMRELVVEAMRAGAVGFATSKAPTHVGYEGRPVPSRLASLDEIAELAGALGESEHGVVQATIGRGFLTDQFAEIARENGKPFSWTALLGGAFGPEGHRGFLEQASKLQAEGVQVVPQVSARPLMFEFQWKAPFPFESMRLFQPVSAADFEGKKKIYADPEFRRRFRERDEPTGFGVRWDRTTIADCPGQPELAERCVDEVARERGVHPADLALDLGLESELEVRFRSAIANADEEIVGELLAHPAAMLGLSDAGAHASQLCDACFSTHLLGHWVREKGVLSLEEAVRLLTSRSADVFGLVDRGRVAEGMAADLVVFDPATVGCGPLERVHDQPGGADRLRSQAFGIDAVIVNGIVLRQDGQDQLDPQGPLPGRVLRGGQA